MAEMLSAGAMEQALKRLLKHSKTRCYFDGGGWTENPNKAQCFADEIEAVRACVCHDLRDVELVLRYQPDGADVFCTAIR